MRCMSEYAAVVESGLMVQIDDACLASYYDVSGHPRCRHAITKASHVSTNIGTTMQSNKPQTITCIWVTNCCIAMIDPPN
jgi:hypothetical protein